MVDNKEYNQYSEEVFLKIFSNMMHNEYDKLLDKITKQFGEECDFTKEELQEEFPYTGVRFMKLPNEKNIQERKIKSMKEFYEEDIKTWSSHRCVARTMPENGQVPPFVYYYEKEKRWIVGVRCRRKVLEGKEVCGCHKNSMPYGRYDRDMPLCGYERYMYPIKNKKIKNKTMKV